jgi:aryl-alcohol dehydrogenase
MKVKAAIVLEPGADFVIKEVELDQPKATEVLVKMLGVGVCRTDSVARHQGIPTPLPAVFGHEGAGVVEQVGSAVRDIQVGDRVLISFYSCGHCDCCRSGHPTMCHDYERVNLFGGTYADGTTRMTYEGKPVSSFFGQSTFAEYAVTDEENCVVVNDDRLDIAIMGALGCGLQTGAGAVINKLRPKVGDSFVVFGCGAVGMTALIMAKNAGCSEVIGVDLAESRLELAKELGATHVINGQAGETVAEIKRITGGGADCSLDTTAVPAIIRQAMICLRAMGQCGVVGSTGPLDLTFKPQSDLMDPNISLHGIIEGESVPKVFIPRLIKLHKEGKFPFDRLIREYKFEDINQAFADSENGSAIKPIIRF